jgi:hypothetical protein
MKIFAVRGTISLQDVAYTHVYARPEFQGVEGEPVGGDLMRRAGVADCGEAILL